MEKSYGYRRESQHVSMNSENQGYSTKIVPRRRKLQVMLLMSKRVRKSYSPYYTSWKV
jgi:hypothetical protein